MLEELQERVTRGAELLDERRPGWALQIDVGNLDMESCEFCIVGQLCGEYDLDALQSLSIIEFDATTFPLGAGVPYGFAIEQRFGYGVDGSYEEDRGYRILQDLWVGAIKERVDQGVVI